MTIKVLVPISGGKDSQAALKLALQTHQPSEVRGLFCDTRFEHPMTYAHVD
jgi:3'-phosphoadenosine 5'-phosphosulfate sulfotransferase (PAPS reductase)/FAD synthetase